jgi:putative SOS response-associated peptidase YedK
MCGRFVLFNVKETLIEKFRIDEIESDPAPNYNIAPSLGISAVIRDGNKNKLVKLHWGLVPFWAKDKSIGSKMINGRIETVAEKPAFKNAFKKRRCLILADGFYEWQGKEGNKQPYYISIPSDEPFAFAGLWESWDKEEPVYKSCTIITIESSGPVQEIHHRMPVILKPENHDKWLDPKIQASKELMAILQEGMIRDMKYHPVSKRVNKAENNDKRLLDPIHL